MSKRICGNNGNTNDTKVPVETLAKRPATAFSESSTIKAGSRSIKILSRIEEQEGNRGPRTSENSNRKICSTIFDAGSPENSSNLDKLESSRFETDSLDCRENEFKAIYKNQSTSAATHPTCNSSFKYLSENSSEKRGPLVELSALHKVLDRLRPDDLESTGAWYSSESCCREIVLRFKNLLSEWSSDIKRIDESLSVDDSLIKCEHCGVIRCLETPRYQKSLLERRHNEGITTAEQEAETTSKIPMSSIKSPKKSVEIMRNSCPVMPSRCRSDAMTREKLPITKINNQVVKNNVTRGTNDKKIGNQPCEISLTRNRKMVNCKDSQGSKTSKDIDDTFLFEEGKHLDEKYSKHGQEKTNPPMETVKYLARGNFAAAKNKSKESLGGNLPKDIEMSHFQKFLSQGKKNFALHGSRDVDFHHDPQFLICDRLKFPEDKMKTDVHTNREDTSKIDTSNPAEDTASFSERSDVQMKESNTSTFSSSSAENMIRRWIKPSINVFKTDAKKVKDTARQDSTAETSLHNVQNIRARITDAIQKFSNRSDESLRSQPNGSSEKKSSDNISMIKLGRKINTSEFRNKNSTCHSRSTLSVMSSENLENQFLSVENSERFERQILYDEISLRDTISENSIKAADSKVLPMYRKIVESNEEMDWESFERLVSVLHPCQRELWCDICRAVSAEAKRVADETGATTEVCIEVNPLPQESDKPIIRSRGNEITFELDMIVKDVNALMEMNNTSGLKKKANKEKKQSSESDSK